MPDKPEDKIHPRMVFRFDKPHRVGSICGANCATCGACAVVVGLGGRLLPSETPFFILAKARRKDWEQSVKAQGGNTEGVGGDYYYFVSVPD